MALIDARLAEILVCADCHGDLSEDEPQSVLVCDKCGLRFSVTDGIPNMIVAQAGR